VAAGKVKLEQPLTGPHPRSRKETFMDNWHENERLRTVFAVVVVVAGVARRDDR
jgi:hypothetical protein